MPDKQAKEQDLFPQFDSPGNILKCCHCTKDKCTNCLSSKSTGKRQQQLDEAREMFLKLYYENKSRREICADMNISTRTYFNYKQMFLKPISDTR